MDRIADELVVIQLRFPHARVDDVDGQRLLVVPDVTLRDEWNQPTTTIRVLIPVGYPHVTPDSFFTDHTLHLAAGTAPSNTGIQAVFGATYLWFSWHLAGWNPATDSLDRYLRFCEARLKEPR